MNNAARTSVISFLLRDLKLLKKIGNPEEKAEIPAVEKILLEACPCEEMAVSFATAEDGEAEDKQ